jgi:hypothetical protein
MLKIKNLKTNTYPIAIHMNGGLNLNSQGQKIWLKLWNYTRPHVQKFKPGKESLRNDCCLSFMNHGSHIDLAGLSLEMFGLQYENIANGIKDKLPRVENKRNKYIQWVRETQLLKIEAFREFIEKNRKKYYIGWDNTDVFFIDHPNRIVERFESEFNCEMLLNAEINCSPIVAKQMGLYKKLPMNGFQNFLNSGLFIVKREFFMDNYNLLDSKKVLAGDGADQSKFHQLYSDKYPEIQIDSNCRIFQSSSEIPDNTLKIIE